jgi:GAF domain-containing protein
LSSDDEALIQSIAYQVAVALENAQTYSQTQKQAERATVINDISRKIQNTSTVEQALQVAVRELGKTLGVRESRIMLDLPDSVLKDIR